MQSASLIEPLRLLPSSNNIYELDLQNINLALRWYTSHLQKVNHIINHFSAPAKFQSQRSHQAKPSEVYKIAYSILHQHRHLFSTIVVVLYVVAVSSFATSSLALSNEFCSIILCISLSFNHTPLDKPLHAQELSFLDDGEIFLLK